MYRLFPFTYTFSSRLNSKAEKASWLIIYPIFIMLFSFTALDANFSYVLLVLISLISVYEVGYLFNDFWTTRKEIDPTNRENDNTAPFKKHFSLYVGSRLVITTTLSLYIFVVFGDLSCTYFSFLVLIAFYLHNTIRSRVNVLTYFSLVTLRYVGPLFIFLTPLSIIVVILCFPLCRTIEHSCKRKYRFERIRSTIKDPDRFRVYYYSILLSTITLLCFYIDEWILFWPVFYYFVFRVLALLVRDKINRFKHPSY